MNISSRIAIGSFGDRTRPTLDIYYDSKERVTGVESGSAKGSSQLILEAMESIEALPVEYLRPRFAGRVSSPTGLVVRHTKSLETAGLSITGVRIAQYELMYDIEPVDGTAHQQPVHLTVRYDHRGIVTWCNTDDSPTASRALAALSLESIAEQARDGLGQPKSFDERSK